MLILSIKVLGLVRLAALGHNKRQQVSARALLEDLGVLVHGGVDAEADGAPHHLGDLALVDGFEARLVGVLYAAEGGHVVGDEGEVLFFSREIVSAICPTWPTKKVCVCE